MRTILLLLSFPLGLLSLIDTIVTVKYTLSCESQEAFTYRIQLFEEDLHFDDQLALEEGNAMGVAEGILRGKDNGDSGNEYEFFIHIKHNCRAKGRVKRVELRPVCLLGTPNCDYNIYVNLDIR